MRRLRKLRDGLQCRREEHALHELPSHGREGGRDHPHPDQSGVAGETKRRHVADSREARRRRHRQRVFHHRRAQHHPLGWVAQLHRNPAALRSARPCGIAGAGVGLQWQWRFLRPRLQRRIGNGHARLSLQGNPARQRRAGTGTEHRRRGPLQLVASGISTHRRRRFFVPLGLGGSVQGPLCGAPRSRHRHRQ